MSFGYFLAFFSIFAVNASARSTWQTSASRMRYEKTSANSYPTCFRYASLKEGSPSATSPFHWKTSATSPTSPTNAITKFRGVWNCSQSRSFTNVRSLSCASRKVKHLDWIYAACCLSRGSMRLWCLTLDKIFKMMKITSTETKNEQSIKIILDMFGL